MTYEQLYREALDALFAIQTAFHTLFPQISRHYIEMLAQEHKHRPSASSDPETDDFLANLDFSEIDIAQMEQDGLRPYVEIESKALIRSLSEKLVRFSLAAEQDPEAALPALDALRQADKLFQPE